MSLEDLHYEFSTKRNKQFEKLQVGKYENLRFSRTSKFLPKNIEYLKLYLDVNFYTKSQQLDSKLSKNSKLKQISDSQ